jgi:hypothetical protein
MGKRRKTGDSDGEGGDPPRRSVGAAFALLASLEREPTAWRRLQHQHLRRFPKTTCTHCAAPLCLQCGAASWHAGMACADHLRDMARSVASDDVRQSLLWQLEHRCRPLRSIQGAHAPLIAGGWGWGVAFPASNARRARC